MSEWCQNKKCPEKNNQNQIRGSKGAKYYQSNKAYTYLGYWCSNGCRDQWWNEHKDTCMNAVGFIDKQVFINRVASVVKGGRRFSFAALVVAGNQKGHVGFGHGKAREVPEAVKKATDSAKNSLIKVPLKEGRTLHHDIEGRHGAGKVILRTAPPGTGIISGGPMRAVFEVLGVQDVVAKSIGSSNPYNMVRATIDALSKIDSPRQVAARRNKKVSEVFSKLDNEEEVTGEA